MWMIQYMEAAADCDDAQHLLKLLQRQDGCVGGRVLGPVNQIDKNCWRVQVFFEDTDSDPRWKNAQADWLPDGCRRVYVMDSQRRIFGLPPVVTA